MGIVEAIILGIIQGLTEFLPVSSSGHLELANAVFGHQVGEENLLMTVTLHGATALATILVFKKDVAEIIRGLFEFKKNEELEFSLKIILSMIPAAFVGLVYEDAIESLFSGNILLVGSMLIITGILLFFADRAKNTDKKVGYVPALIIGLSQAIAILPGISRSGATISTSVLLGIDRGKAARFSFLMVVPLILGKMAKDILDGAFTEPDVNIPAIAAGFIAAFITGYFACTWMIALVKRSKLSWFSIYCILVGTIAIVWSLT
ncbi:MAG: undecaprenyl-diphosphate phosphatase [Flavobacteriales bacterium]|nr:undecaprenyl-diphosphate phosphatase [Flavobacteriales bacterium]